MRLTSRHASLDFGARCLEEAGGYRASPRRLRDARRGACGVGADECCGKTLNGLSTKAAQNCVVRGSRLAVGGWRLGDGGLRERGSRGAVSGWGSEVGGSAARVERSALSGRSPALFAKPPRRGYLFTPPRFAAADRPTQTAPRGTANRSPRTASRQPLPANRLPRTASRGARSADCVSLLLRCRLEAPGTPGGENT